VKALTKRLVDFGKSDDVVQSVYDAPNTKNTAAKKQNGDREKKFQSCVSKSCKTHTNRPKAD
jgi:hypothetical protein